MATVENDVFHELTTLSDSGEEHEKDSEDAPPGTTLAVDGRHVESGFRAMEAEQLGVLGQSRSVSEVDRCLVECCGLQIDKLELVALISNIRQLDLEKMHWSCQAKFHALAFLPFQCACQACGSEEASESSQ